MLLNPRLFVLPHKEIRACGLTALTYGSLTMKGLGQMSRTILRYMRPDSIHGFDLGCGDGELIWHLGLALDGSTWHGVEISESRVEAQMRDVCIWQGDMLDENFKTYNLLHADNLCLDETVADLLEKKIADEFTGLYISYREPISLEFLRRAVLVYKEMTETTWSTCLLRYYYLA
jgi:hypothetical protein